MGAIIEHAWSNARREQSSTAPSCTIHPWPGFGVLTVLPLALLAQTVRTGRRVHWDSRILWAALGLVAVMLAGAIVISLVDRWRRQPRQQWCNPSDQLAHFRTLYERGELSLEEFERVQRLLKGRMKDQFEATAATAGTADPPAPASREVAGDRELPEHHKGEPPPADPVP